MAQRETLLVLRVHKLAVKIICDEDLLFHVKKLLLFGERKYKKGFKA